MLILYDIHIETMILERAVGQDAMLTLVACTWDYRAVGAATQNQTVRVVNPREHLTLTFDVLKTNSGTRPKSVLWCRLTQHLVVCRPTR